MHNTEHPPLDEGTVEENEEVEEMEKLIKKTNLEEQEKNWSRDWVRTCATNKDEKLQNRCKEQEDLEVHDDQKVPEVDSVVPAQK